MGQEIDRYLIAENLIKYIREKKASSQRTNPILNTVNTIIKNYPGRKKELDTRTLRNVTLGVGSLIGDVDKITDNDVLEDRKKKLQNRFKHAKLPADAGIIFDTAIDTIDIQIDSNDRWNAETASFYGEGTGHHDKLLQAIQALPQPDANGNITFKTDEDRKTFESLQSTIADFVTWNQDLSENHNIRLSSPGSQAFRSDVSVLTDYTKLMTESIKDKKITAEELEPFVNGLDTFNATEIQNYYNKNLKRDQNTEHILQNRIGESVQQHIQYKERYAKFTSKSNPMKWDEEAKGYIPLGSMTDQEKLQQEAFITAELIKYEELIAGDSQTLEEHKDMTFAIGIGYIPYDFTNPNTLSRQQIISNIQSNQNKVNNP